MTLDTPFPGYPGYSVPQHRVFFLPNSRGCHSHPSLCDCLWCYCLAGALTTSSACLHALSGNFLQQEYTLTHTEPPDSLEAAEAGIRKFEDFLMSMDSNREKVLSPVDSGNKLVAEGNLYSEKIKEKVQLIEDRYSLLTAT